MSLRFGNREFAPRAWSVLLTVAGVGVFVTLGTWQLGRAHEKQALVESFQRGADTNVALGPGVAFDALPRYQHVQVTGHYEPGRQVLIDNMPSQSGKPGYRVLTPLRRAEAARLLLVDRGWVPLGESRATLPDVQVAAGNRLVSGRLDGLPAPGVRVGEAGVPGDTHWPRVLNFPRQADLERALGEPVEARILLLDPSQPDGYERAWRPAMQFGPERHYGYAVQWFAFAIVALVIFVSLSLRRLDAGVPTDTDSNAP
jgi:cytochrome oxidase assembly protein ShyY1